MTSIKYGAALVGLTAGFIYDENADATIYNILQDLADATQMEIVGTDEELRKATIMTELMQLGSLQSLNIGYDHDGSLGFMIMDDAGEVLPPPEVAVPHDDLKPYFVQPIPLQHDDELQKAIDGLARVREQSIETYFDNEAALDIAEHNFDRQVEQGYWDRMYQLQSGEITTD
jgi:hypothetical protein